MLKFSLGARDSLRLEAGLCLHGHDISPSITPKQASLLWTVRKNNLTFLGSQAFQADKPTDKRVGFIAKEGILREGQEIFDEKGVTVGKVCSGTYSPILKKGIGMAYILNKQSKVIFKIQDWKLALYKSKR